MYKTIVSAQNAQLKQLAKLLSSAKERRACRMAVLEGLHLADAYLQTGALPEQLWVPEWRLAQAEVAALAARVPAERIMVAAQDALAKISSLSDADDVMMLVRLPDVSDVPVCGDCVLLDGVQDPGNIGTVLRSAAAADVRQVLLGTGCADVWSPKVLRAGMGAHFLLSLHERVDLAVWCGRYQGKVLATALHEHNNFSLYELDLSADAAWVFGNEGSGVSAQVLAAANATVRIPMAEGTESLNVAMAATVCLFEQMRQRLLR